MTEKDLSYSIKRCVIGNNIMIHTSLQTSFFGKSVIAPKSSKVQLTNCDFITKLKNDACVSQNISTMCCMGYLHHNSISAPFFISIFNIALRGAFTSMALSKALLITLPNNTVQRFQFEKSYRGRTYI